MFDYIKGILIESTPTKAVIEVHGIGYILHIPLSQYTQLPPLGSGVCFYTAFIVREDSHKLFGFLHRENRDLFEILVDISGIGPKTALTLLGHLEVDALHAAIRAADTQLLSKIPGIGKKTADRLIVEMRDKVKKNGAPLLPSLEPDTTQVVKDALSALLNLGYQHSQAHRAVHTAFTQFDQEPNLAQLITSALRIL